MKTDLHKTIHLKDYKPYPYKVEHIDLNFDIHEGYTLVTAKTRFVTNREEDIFLNGERLELVDVKLDGAAPAYTKDDKGITIPCPGKKEFTLEIITRIHPETNTWLEGLYNSGGTYCTQCEAEGFRSITYYPDRPDVMATYTVRIEADKKYPVLLSNGNLVESGLCKSPPHPNPLPNGERESEPKAKTGEGERHYAIWHDPFPKPCYLFALVAGDLAHIHDTYKTTSGRKVDLYIYVRKGDEGQCQWAIESLKKAMKWDEDTYGLEYDLDIFNIVAVSDFNMGAMENKSLNIFNTALVLAHPDTATDMDFLRVESVIAHEYFHNWSGDRVTCRDWFQLSLKEGLTVFRDQEFSADLNSRAVQRIDDVVHLRRFQFPEDSGPLAHPVRPDNYIEINNFYTMTVYEKGAEVIRMIRTILGPENYRKGTDLYFSRHDGQAVTCEDFVKCMEDASGVDLKHFRLWYEQAGTPEVTFKGSYDAAKKTYTVELSQTIPDTPGQRNKKPMVIPVALGLMNENGDSISLSSPGLTGGPQNRLSPTGSSAFAKDDTAVLLLNKESQTFTFDNIASKPVVSVLRGFSAPVKLKTDHTDEDLAFLMVHDSDGFNRWDSGHSYFLRTLNAMIDGHGTPAHFFKNYGGLLERALDPTSDKALMARALALPDVSIIGLGRDVIDPAAIYGARESLLKAIVEKFGQELEKLYVQNRSGKDYALSPEAVGKRALQSITLSILDADETANAPRVLEQYKTATNMTDRLAALAHACEGRDPAYGGIIADFHERFKSFPLVIDKWFAVQVGSVRGDIQNVLKHLRAHADFNIRNPNRARSLFGALASGNPVCFHAADGSGYNFLTEGIIELNAINPQIAARLLSPMRDWRRYTQDRQEKMKDSLQKILKTPKISPDVFEIASKSLKG